MKNNFQEKLKLGKLYKELRNTERLYDKKLHKLKKEGFQLNSPEFQSLWGEKSTLTNEIKSHIILINTRQLKRKAIKLGVPLPDYKNEDFWEDIYGSMILTEKGRYELIKKIRQEKKERRDPIITIIVILIGLIGAVTGLISVMKN